ncbi:T9SS type A sorting domain-containing protein [Lewinella sp. 4G2]|uniref:T9SS type A sorting domain-containing protein n=1 Tax=Lewinella sp. 4G2 TaxID=1803372 RepID=UPI0007B48BDA|nr:T9SS type A sorting domain-containing protein [Lewinella sp. 4G2]OAV45294.1 hypothetical protein A3850_012670 [Lewinella sp. 4G2]
MQTFLPTIKNLPLLLLLLLIGLGPVQELAAQRTTVSINPNVVLSELGARNRIGLNMNTWSDNDRNTSIKNETMFNNMGTKFIRFPGGEKADAYKWTANINRPNPATATMLRRGPNDFPVTDSKVWSNGDWAETNYNFDMFIADCKAAKAEAVVVVALDYVFKEKDEARRQTLVNEAIGLATAWVKYAKDNNIDVAYWELGNESWLANSKQWAGKRLFDGNTKASARAYAQVAKVMADEMKKVDSKIKIGINADGKEWYDEVQRVFDLQPREKFDFVAIHTYPYAGVDRYATYRNRVRDALTNSVAGVISANARAFPAGGNRARPKIIVTEFSASGFAGSNKYERNTIGQALANFEMTAQLMGDSRVAFSQFWGSRYDVASLPKSGDSAWNAVNNNNVLTAQGRAVSLIAKNAKGQMIKCTENSKLVNAYASLNTPNKITLFLVNRGAGDEIVDLDILNAGQGFEASYNSYNGGNLKEDAVSFRKSPNSSKRTTKRVIKGLRLDPVSITVVTITKTARNSSKNLDGGSSVAPNSAVFPNPSSGQFNVSSSLRGLPFRVQDGSGKLIQRGKLTNTIIDASTWKAGVYFLTVDTSEGAVTHRLVKR